MPKHLGLSFENLRLYGAEPITRWLIAAAKKRHTITYGEAKSKLEETLGFSTIFPTTMGQPAGQAMDSILEIDDAAPLLNVLLVRQSDGMPGSGAGPYMADYFGEDWLREKNARNENPVKWRSYFERAARDVYNFDGWEELYKRVYRRKSRLDKNALAEEAATGGSEKDGLPHGRKGEGKNHRTLRLWVKNNPSKVIRNIGAVDAETEVDLLSGDRVDVVFYSTSKTIAVEVKSKDSASADLLRGIYQCVKYRAVLLAMDARSNAPVDCVLVTEKPLPGYLSKLADRLTVKHVKVPEVRK